jgi:hypothetical protein
MARKRVRKSAGGSTKKGASKTPPVVSDRHAMAVAFRDQAAQSLNEIGAVMQSDIIDNIYGIPLVRNLPLQYLIGVDVIPMERTISLVGKEGSLKSIMSWYFGTMFLRYEHPGMVFFVDAEHKTNYDQIRGIVQNDNLLDLMFPVKVHNLTEMCETLAIYAQKYEELVPAADLGCCYIVDSIGAVTSKAAQEAVETTHNAANVAGYDAARRAAMLTEQFRAWVPKYLTGKPATLVYINHLKFKIGEDSNRPGHLPPEKTSPGGAHKDFLNTATIEMIKMTTPAIKSEMRALIQMRTLKASLTETGRKIQIMMRTIGPSNCRYPEGDTLGKEEVDGDVQRLYVYFDWDTALIELLTREKGSTFEKSVLNNVITITGTGNALGCKRLGISGASKQELGAAIHADPAICRELQVVLVIFRKRPFIPPGSSSKAVPGKSKEEQEAAEE